MAPRAPVDWEAIEREYRAGQLSLRQIGVAFGVSHTAVRKRAAAEGWTQNLAERVREEVSTRLVSAEVSAQTAKEIVEVAAARGVDVILRHRAGLTRQNDHLLALQDKLENLIPGLEDMGEIERAQSIVESMARTRARLIPLERQAFALDAPHAPIDAGRDEPGGAARMLERMRARAAERMAGHAVADPPAG